MSQQEVSKMQRVGAQTKWQRELKRKEGELMEGAFIIYENSR